MKKSEKQLQKDKARGELKMKNGQIRHWADKQKYAEEQIHIQAIAIESASDGIFIIDAQRPDFPITYANPAFREMIGHAKSNIVGRNYFLLYEVSGDQRIIEKIKQNILQGKSFDGEMLNFRKNGEKCWNLLRLALVRNANGTVTHYVGTQTDITSMKQKELEIKEQREELLHVTRVGKMAEFVSSLAHEISQPLTAILSYAQAARRMLADREPRLKEILQHIINDDQRAAEVIRRLRSLLKKTKPVFEPLNINVLINETIELILTDLTVRNTFLKTDLQQDLPLILGDRIQLQQVLLNLFSNSFDAMENNDDTCDLLIRTSYKVPNMILVAVQDSGCGVSKQNMSKLFTHFFSSKPDGLGMGLSISRSIVEAHGGHLNAENNPERGATFYFTLPVGIAGIKSYS